jgi:hypothetical protein
MARQQISGSIQVTDRGHAAGLIKFQLNVMKKITIAMTAVIILISIALIAVNSEAGSSANMEGISEMPPVPAEDSMIRRGQYLVTIMGCNDCHSPIVMTPRGPGIDSSRMLSGHPETVQLPFKGNATEFAMFSLSGTAIKGPWGISYAANITSDETGIGNWTEKQFFKAIREGKYKGLDNSRQLLPPMPWEGYAKASDEDLRAIFLYLKSTPPVENHVPASIPFNETALH